MFSVKSCFGDKQIHYINENVDLVKKDLFDKDKINLFVSKLNSDCIICYEILKELSKESIELSNKFDNWKLYKNSNDNTNKNDTTNIELKRIRKDIYLNSDRFGGITLFILFVKWLFIFLLTPLFMLPWLFRDPYLSLFCNNHFDLRPIKDERKRKLIIYSLTFLAWFSILILILVIFILNKKNR